jgi:hypothetical protein
MLSGRVFSVALEEWVIVAETCLLAKQARHFNHSLKVFRERKVKPNAPGNRLRG